MKVDYYYQVQVFISVILLLSVFCALPTASAATYKCKNAKGDVFFQNDGCVYGSTGAEVSRHEIAGIFQGNRYFSKPRQSTYVPEYDSDNRQYICGTQSFKESNTLSTLLGAMKQLPIKWDDYNDSQDKYVIEENEHLKKRYLESIHKNACHIRYYQKVIRDLYMNGVVAYAQDKAVHNDQRVIQQCGMQPASDSYDYHNRKYEWDNCAKRYPVKKNVSSGINHKAEQFKRLSKNLNLYWNL